MKTNLVVLVLVAMLWKNGPAQAAPVVDEVIKVTETLSLQRLHEGVWLHISLHPLSNGELFPGNGLLVADDDALVLVDTPWGEDNTEALVTYIKSQWDMPISAALVTHFHADSSGGAGVLAGHGIPVMASEQTIALVLDQAQYLTSLGDLVPGVILPFKNLEVLYPGPAHSVDNLAVYIPSAGIVFGTCAVRSPSYPGKGNTADADQVAWPGSVQSISETFPNAGTVVPGHGPVGDSQLLQHTIDLFVSGD